MVRKESHAAAPTETLEGLLAQKDVDAWLLCLSPSEERLYHGAIFTLLDWRFRGALSRAYQAGALASMPGEVSLLPCTRPVGDLSRETFRILTVGVKNRASVSSSEFSLLARNVHGLGLKKIGVSASDFGWTPAEAKKHFSALKGVEACVIE